MKLLVTLACLFIVVRAASDEKLWIKFKNNHGKTYKSLKEEELRFNIFREKLREIDSHNAKYDRGEVSYFMRVNQFSDLTEEEFVSMLNNNIATEPNFHAIPFEEVVDDNVSPPDAINWVEKGAVSEVKNQGSCGSCWAFSATGSIEGQNFIKNNKSVSLSEQYLVDCSIGHGNDGCGGGSLPAALLYVKKHGIASESAYPYQGVLGDCQNAETVVNISGYVFTGGDDTSRGYEDRLQMAVGTVGPVSVKIQGTYFHSYGGGIFDDPRCTGIFLNHAVLVVGYGSEDGKDYWLIKNSWGATWGEEGYIRLARNKGNQCGLSWEAYYPIM